MREKSIARRWLTIASLLILPFCMNACASGPIGGDRWKEEVLLHDGQKIIVDRTVKRHGPHEIGQRPPIGDQSVSFTLPGTDRHVIWKDEYSQDVGGANFNLMLLDIVQGTPYLLATPAGCLSYNKWGRPNPPYVIFRYDGKAWQRIPLQALPAEITLPNLLHSSPDDVAEKRAVNGVVSAAVIKQENEEYRQPEYKTILREPIGRESSLGMTSCPIPTTAAATLIAPVINGQIMEYNWWPLAQDWLSKTLRGNNK